MSSPPWSDLLFLLSDIGRLLRVEWDQRARAHGMTRAQWILMIWLERRPGLSQKEMSELIEVEPISVARLVDRLEMRGMVERRHDPADRRVWRLHLTDAAKPVLEDIAQARAQSLANITGGLDEATLALVKDALVGMKHAVCTSLGKQPAESVGAEELV